MVIWAKCFIGIFHLTSFLAAFFVLLNCHNRQISIGEIVLLILCVAYFSFYWNFSFFYSSLFHSSLSPALSFALPISFSLSLALFHFLRLSISASIANRHRAYIPGLGQTYPIPPIHCQHITAYAICLQP